MGAGAQSNVRLSVAQRGILINPGGAQGTIQQRKRQNGQQDVQASPLPNGGQPNNGATSPPPPNNNGQINNGNIGTGTINNNPAATNLLLSPTFTPIQANAILDALEGRLAIPVSQVDGEYIITVSMAGAGGQAPLQGGAQPNPEVPQASIQPIAGEPQGIAQPVAGVQPGARPIPIETTPDLAPTPRPVGAAQPGAIAEPGRPAVGEPQGVPRAGEPRPVAEPLAPAAPQPVPVAGVAPPVREPLPAAPVPVPSSGFITKRQLPPLPKSQADGSVIVSMEWINYMAGIQRQGGAINVGAMMAQVSPSIVDATSPAASGSPNIASLLGSLKARKFRA